MSPEDRLFDQEHPLEIADQGSFFVGGRYLEVPDGQVMAGQMFVQYQVPRSVSHAFPLVLIHGGSQTAVNFLATPDGRRTWSDYFLANGFAVYIVDQPGRGRSGYFPEAYGTSKHRNALDRSTRFTATANSRPWPQAHLHTQWPGDGVPGDAVFDQFYASQVESMTDVAMTEQMMREAVSALLDRIGPSVLLTHSQSGLFGWSVADNRPALVKGIVAIEPSGPPRHEVRFTHPPQYFEDGELTRAWGITYGPLRFAPPAASPEELKFVRQENPDSPHLVRCWLQAEPARQMPNLQGIPILLLTSEASMHATYCHCTSKFLSQAGVQHQFIRLEEVGIRGNGHMMMLEKNSMEIARFLQGWIEANTR